MRIASKLAALCAAALCVAMPAAAAQASTATTTITTICPAWTLHSLQPGATSFSTPPAAGSMVENPTTVVLAKPVNSQGVDGRTEFDAYTLNLNPTKLPLELEVDYALAGGASTVGQAVRLVYYDTQNANTLDNAPTGEQIANGVSGTMVLLIGHPIGTIGMLYDVGNPALGTVTFSNLRLVDPSAGEETDLHFLDDCAASSPSPSASPTPSASMTPAPSHAPFPVGGVRTGGGKPATSIWLPFGAGLAGLAVLTLAGAVITRRRQRQGS